MAYIELYNKTVLDLVNLGKTIKDFNTSMGDYIKVELFRENNLKLKTIESLRKIYGEDLEIIFS